MAKLPCDLNPAAWEVTRKTRDPAARPSAGHGRDTVLKPSLKPSSDAVISSRGREGGCDALHFLEWHL